MAKPSLAAMVSCALVATTVSAQVVYVPSLRFNGDSAADWFGISVSNAGDVNNDGFADIIVGASQDDNNGSNSGSARVLSGATGAILYTFNGNSASDYFGGSVNGAGDVNNDGFDDVIVGAYGDAPNGLSSGSAQVFSGATGAVLYTLNGDSASDNFGGSVSGAGDVNNDGYADFIIGAQGYNGGAGAARVYSGATGAIIHVFNGDAASDHFGTSVSGAGDVNNDGYDDLIAGANLDDDNGSACGMARVFSGATGAILYTFYGDSAFDNFGESVSGAGDVNNDGFDDVIVGAIQDDNTGSNAGSARVFSGATGAILYTFNGDSGVDFFGKSVSSAGDVNNDGFDDVIVGATGDGNTGPSAGSARVFSGANGANLFTFNGDSSYDGAGASVSAGDFNNDGFVDFLIGAKGDDNNGADSGSVHFVFTTVAFDWGSVPPFCPGDADDSGSVNFADITKVLENWLLTCP